MAVCRDISEGGGRRRKNYKWLKVRNYTPPGYLFAFDLTSSSIHF